MAPAPISHTCAMSANDPLHAGSSSRRNWLIRTALLGLAGTPGPWAAHARAAGQYPDRPVQLLVPFGPGGIADYTARTVTEVMAKRLGQPIVIDNRPSAGGIIAGQAVARAKADGYTLLLMSNANAVSVSLFKSLPFDTEKDLAGISTLGSFDLGLFVAQDSPIRDVPALIDRARREPGRLNVGTISVGSTQHLAARLFLTTANVDMLVVPYKGSPAVATALRAGEIDVAFEITGPMLPQVQSGAVRALAVTSTQRNPALPDVPTVAEAGLKGYDVASWNALAAPAGTPPSVIRRLNEATRDALADPEVRDKLQRYGMRVADSSPSEFDDLLAREIQRWGQVVRAAHIEAQ